MTPPLDLRTVEARLANGIRFDGLRPVDLGEWDAILGDGEALLAQCRALRAALEGVLVWESAHHNSVLPADLQERAAAVLASVVDGEAAP